MVAVSDEVKIGVYRLGWRFIELWVDPTWLGGRVITGPAPESTITRMIIGLNDHWKGVVGVLTHESVEIAAWDMGTQYRKSGEYSETTNGYYFMFDHQQFTEIADRAGYFMAQVLPDLSTAYRKLTKKK